MAVRWSGKPRVIECVKCGRDFAIPVAKWASRMPCRCPHCKHVFVPERRSEK